MSRNLAYYLSGVVTVLAASCGGGGSDDASPAQPQVPAQCAPVLVQMFGDSTQEQQGQNLQRYMDDRFGSGRVVVENNGISGTISSQFHPETVKPAAITASNYGINDHHYSVPLGEFEANLRRVNSSFYETPSPPRDAYAPSVRAVAAELGRPVIDVSAWVRSQPGWEQHVPDGIHPDAWLYQQITTRLVGPTIGDAIAAQVCK